MVENEIDMESSYVRKCLRTLKEWGAPLKDWSCIYMIDQYGDNDDGEEFATCELCGCKKVRFVHVMIHPDYFERVEVGCICAGLMEGDILAAKERERKLRNRYNRLMNFKKKTWGHYCDDLWQIRYKGKCLCIYKNSDGTFYATDGRGKAVHLYKGEPIHDFLIAKVAAFYILEERI